MSLTCPSPRLLQNSVPRLAGVWLFALILLLSFAVFAIRESLGSPASGDLKRFWAAAGVLASHLNPYDLSECTRFAATHGAGLIDALPLYYPPLAFAPLLPFTLLPFEAFREIFLAAVAASYIMFWVAPASREFLAGVRGAAFHSLLPLSIVLSFLPVLLMWWVGALTFLPFFGLLGYFLLSRHEPQHLFLRVAAGFLVSLILVKPTVCPLVIPFLVVVWFRQRAIGEIWGFLAGFLALLLPFVFLLPDPIHILAATDFGEALLWNTPAPARYLQLRFGLPMEARFVPCILSIAATFWYASSVSLSSRLVRPLCLVSIPLGIAVTPFAWTYDFSLLIFTLSYLIWREPVPSGDAKREDWHPWALELILVMNLVLMAMPLQMEIQWWYPLGLLLVTVPVARSSGMRK